MSNEQVWWGQLDNDNKIHALAFTSLYKNTYFTF